VSAAAKKRYDPQTQYICMTKPFCTCAGGPNEWDECCCIRTHGGVRCQNCDVMMVLIDMETGEPVTS
jgi:hypothetical protein